jgi:hypothetical protein
MRMHACSLIAGAAVLAAVTGAAALAQSKKFKDEFEGLHQTAAHARAAKGLDLDDPSLERDYPGPNFQAVDVQKVLAGGSVSVALAGTLPPGVAILSDRDGAVLSGDALTGTSYKARMTIGAGEGPGFVKIWAFTPVSFALTSVPVAFIDTVYRLELKSADGITVKATPTAASFSLEHGGATLPYHVEFYKGGQATPFETLKGSMDFSQMEDPRLRLDIQLEQEGGELEQVMSKMSDPTLTAEQRGDLMVKMVQLMEKQREQAANTSPEAEQRTLDDFGCHILQVYPEANGTAEGDVSCGKNFHGGVLRTTVTMTPVR